MNKKLIPCKIVRGLDHGPYWMVFIGDDKHWNFFSRRFYEIRDYVIRMDLLVTEWGYTNDEAPAIWKELENEFKFMEELKHEEL